VTTRGNGLKRRPPAEFSLDHKLEEIAVESYSGFRLHQRPVRFRHLGNEYTVKKILDSSVREIMPGSRRRYWFNVLCETGEEFALFFDPAEDRWFLC
jgi:hypothetical protein